MTEDVMPKSKATNAYELLDEVRALIIAEPKRYDQSRFIDRGRPGVSTPYIPFGYPDCGTVGCVAGWVATLKGPKEFAYRDVEGIATEILGIDGLVADELFSPCEVDGRGQTAQHARNGAAHIKRFQDEYREQLLAKKV